MVGYVAAIADFLYAHRRDRSGTEQWGSVNLLT